MHQDVIIKIIEISKQINEINYYYYQKTNGPYEREEDVSFS